MESVYDQIANKCVHFTGLGNISCNAGLRYEDVKVPNARPVQVPCLKDSILSGGSCPRVLFPTKEEVQKEVREIQRGGEMTIKAHRDIKAQILETGFSYGNIVCPSCSGNLHYQSSPDNGHIWANCKCGFGWME